MGKESSLGVGVGVVLRLGVMLRLIFQGLMESTALAKYDFSTFLIVSFFSLGIGSVVSTFPGAILVLRLEGHPRMPLRDLLDM